MRVKSFLEFNKTILNSEEIVDYIISETENAISIHDDGDVMPDFFISIIRKDKCDYELKKVKIKDIIKMDSDVKSYLGSTNRYDDIEHPDYSQVDNPIVIHKNEVFDGYNRILTKYENGEEYIDAYVSI